MQKVEVVLDGREDSFCVNLKIAMSYMISVRSDLQSGRYEYRICKVKGEGIKVKGVFFAVVPLKGVKGR